MAIEAIGGATRPSWGEGIKGQAGFQARYDIDTPLLSLKSHSGDTYESTVKAPVE